MTFSEISPGHWVDLDAIVAMRVYTKEDRPRGLMEQYSAGLRIGQQREEYFITAEEVMVIQERLFKVPA